jgi:uncharacterized membrane protein
MTDNAAPGSGGSTGGGAAPAPAGAGMPDNTAGMVAYITIIPAIIFLVMEPYNKRPFVRFHCFQNIFFCVAWIALSIVLSIIAAIPVIGWLTLILWPIIGLGGLVLWVMLLLKANQGQMWKLPFIGDLAAKQAGV